MIPASNNYIDSVDDKPYRWLNRAFLCAVKTLLLFFIVTSMVYGDDRLFNFQMKLAEKGNAEAQYKIGEMYETGFGVEKNLQEAEKWIKKAADQGNEAAQFKLLYWDLEKNGITADNKDAAKEIKQKARDGNEYAQYYLGMMYVYGVGTREKLAEGESWLSKAALGGVQAAETHLHYAKEEIKKAEERKKQAQLERQREAEKRKAEAAAAEARRKAEEQRRLEAQRKEEEQKKAEAQRRAQQEQQQESRSAAMAAAEAEKERERKKRALLNAREEKQEEVKEQFEADPCSGKSARFLSTCR